MLNLPSLTVYPFLLFCCSKGPKNERIGIRLRKRLVSPLIRIRGELLSPSFVFACFCAHALSATFGSSKRTSGDKLSLERKQELHWIRPHQRHLPLCTRTHGSETPLSNRNNSCDPLSHSQFLLQEHIMQEHAAKRNYC